MNILSLFKPNSITRPPLLEEINMAHKSWIEAIGELDFIDNDLLDYVIFKINAAEQRFMVLIRQAKEQKVVAWPTILIDIKQPAVHKQSLPE